MNSDTGGQNSEARQRQTAADIARKKVLAAYSSSTTFSSQAQTAQQTTQNVGTYKNSPINTAPTNQDLQKYHSAWQNYYQKYYNDYYAKAAKQYIEAEKLKNERLKHDQKVFDAEKLDPAATDNKIISNTLKQTIQKKASSNFKFKKSHKKFIPIFAGVFVVLLVLFLQYNRMIFAPIMAYIAPGNVSDDGIAAVDPTINTAVSDTNKLIITKLNIDVPVHFGISNDTKTVNDAMEHGVAHFIVPGANAFPGQVGNTVITGHSAGDVYSANQYKFIFSGLERLVEGDLIYIDYNKVRYTYRMVGRKTVEPTDVASLKYNGDKKMLTLITCWPLGTSRYRLLISAEQISPTTETNPAGQNQTPANNSNEMPKNENTFFENIWNGVTGN
jgi:sortase A